MTLRCLKKAIRFSSACVSLWHKLAKLKFVSKQLQMLPQKQFFVPQEVTQERILNPFTPHLYSALHSHEPAFYFPQRTHRLGPKTVNSLKINKTPMQVQSLLCLKSSWKKKRTIGWIFRICYQPVPGSNIMWVGQYKTTKKEREWMPSLPLRGVTFETKSPVMSSSGTGRLTEAKYSQPAKSTAHIGWGHPGMTHSYMYRET